MVIAGIAVFILEINEARPSLGLLPRPIPPTPHPNVDDVNGCLGDADAAVEPDPVAGFGLIVQRELGPRQSGPAVDFKESRIGPVEAVGKGYPRESRAETCAPMVSPAGVFSGTGLALYLENALGAHLVEELGLARLEVGGAAADRYHLVWMLFWFWVMPVGRPRSTRRRKLVNRTRHCGGEVVELAGIEPATSSMPLKRSPK